LSNGAAYSLGGKSQVVPDKLYEFWRDIVPRFDARLMFARLGRLDQARDEVNLILEMNPEFSIAEITSSLPFKNPTDLEVYLEALRLAGLPE
jgi:hypothetical protein